MEIREQLIFLGFTAPFSQSRNAKERRPRPLCLA
jgi:hypothetical protein